jgi:hypothetical protein
VDVGSGDGAAVACDAESLSFFCDSRKHLEQQFPVAAFPKNPHPFLHNTGSAETFVVVDCSLML